MGNCVICPSKQSSIVAISGDTIAEDENHKDGDEDAHDSNEPSSPFIHLKRFELGELREATCNFSKDNFIGECRSGHVYQGKIDGRDVAVKKIVFDGSQSHKEWLMELKSMETLHHPNLVELIGYYLDDDHRFSIYEYFPLGSLDGLLLDESYKELDWEKRMKILMGIAEGISYLHSLDPPIIHRGIKTCNVLIDSDFNAKLCNLGFVKHVEFSKTRVMGTLAYVDPEYYKTGKVQTRYDVYGLGIIIMEILTGKAAMFLDENGKCVHIVEWAKPSLKDVSLLRRILDPRIREQSPGRSVFITAMLADWCTADHQTRPRPEVEEILQVLELAAADTVREQQKVEAS